MLGHVLKESRRHMNNIEINSYWLKTKKIILPFNFEVVKPVTNDISSTSYKYCMSFVAKLILSSNLTKLISA